MQTEETALKELGVESMEHSKPWSWLEWECTFQRWEAGSGSFLHYVREFQYCLGAIGSHLEAFKTESDLNRPVSCKIT